MYTSDFDYDLPLELIAQRPLTERDRSRLLLLQRHNAHIAHIAHIAHKQFTDILDLLNPGDVLVVNNSRVIPARLYGRKPTGGKVEILLLEQLKQVDSCTWKVLIGGKRIKEGSEIQISTHAGEASEFVATVTAVLDGSQRQIQFNEPIDAQLETLGHTPLPPYIHESIADAQRYQTIYARPPGSAAAPTAGLHFTPDLLFALRQKKVLLETITLHVGLDTFKPVEAVRVDDHIIHSEWATVTPETAKRINEAKLAGGRIVAVGTTAVRTLETAALRSAGVVGSLQTISQRDANGETSDMCPWKPVSAFAGSTDLFIYPGYIFRAVDAMITNFHLPHSSLLMLVSAFAGREMMMAAYETAVTEKYRFFSFGDAMFIE